MADKDKAWEVYIGRANSFGGRVLRRLLAGSEGGCSLWEMQGAAPWPFAWGKSPAGEKKQGLLLPFLELSRENAAHWLPKVALCLQRARDFDRVVLLLGEPVEEMLSLVDRHREKGLQAVAVCAGRGELYGGEKPEDPSGPVEELLDLILARLASASPRKRILLPYGEKEVFRLLYVGDLVSAGLFFLRRSSEEADLLVRGKAYAYGEIAALAARVAGFGGRLQYGKAKAPKPHDLPQGLGTMSSDRLADPRAALAYLTQIRSQLK